MTNNTSTNVCTEIEAIKAQIVQAKIVARALMDERKAERNAKIAARATAKAERATIAAARADRIAAKRAATLTRKNELAAKREAKAAKKALLFAIRATKLADQLAKVEARTARLSAAKIKRASVQRGLAKEKAAIRKPSEVTVITV